VRTGLGRAASHPRAIEVDVRNGVVTLRGHAFSTEASGVLAAAEAAGAQAVHNELELHDTAEGIPSLQGEGRVPQPSLDILQKNWAPATQALVAIGAVALGACLAFYTTREASM
jgi:hypothetical protein